MIRNGASWNSACGRSAASDALDSLSLGPDMALAALTARCLGERSRQPDEP